MSRFRLTVSPCALALAAALWGCSISPTSPSGSPPSGTEQAQVDIALAAAAALVDDDVSGSESQSMGALLDAGGAGKSLIHPLRFWRRIDRVTRTLEIAFADSDTAGRPWSAVATVHKRLAGTFNVIPAPAEKTLPDSLLAIHKPLVDNWARRVQLQRVRSSIDSTRTFWRIVAVSGVDVLSAGATTRIQSLRIQAADLDTTVADPLALAPLPRVLHFAPQDSVRLTVTTARADDVVIFHHHGCRSLFRNNGDNTHTLVLVSGALPGWRHLGVDAIARTALFDSASPYDSNRWHLPFFTDAAMPED